MTLSRRQILAAGMGLLVAGCAQDQQLITQRPTAQWPEMPAGVRPLGTALGDHSSVRPLPSAVRQPAVTPTPESVADQSSILPGLEVVPRTRWAAEAPIKKRLNELGKVSHITVHHEGWKPVYFGDTAATADRLELIRKSHLNRLGAGDIGYHFIIDRAGRVWEGRSLNYQGAHVRNHNPHNLGVMVLGNFDAQSPTDRQLLTLRRTLNALMHKYRVKVDDVYTHQELNPTACPGQHLQPRMVSLRRGPYLT